MSNADGVFGKVQEAFRVSFDVDPQQVTMETNASEIPLGFGGASDACK